MSMVSMIVGRCHVGQSNRAVIGYLASRIKGGRKSFLRLPRATRRELMTDAIREHSANRNLYTRVMTGRL